MSGADVAAEISAALRDVALDLGDASGVFTVTLKPQATGGNPWDGAGVASDPVVLAALDDAIREIYVTGSTATRKARMITLEAIGHVPAVGDKINLKGKDHGVLGVMPLAPSGVALLYDVEITF